MKDEISKSEAQAMVLEKCKVAGLKAALNKNESINEFVSVEIPNGRSQRLINFFGHEHTTLAALLEFEKCVYLGDFIAIANYEAKTIEALISNTNPSHRQRRAMQHLFKIDPDNNDSDLTPINLSSPDGNIHVELGGISDLFSIFARQKGVSIKISGANISTHNKSLELLNNIANSLFFQIDMQLDCVLAVAKHPKRRSRTSLFINSRHLEEDVDVQFPKIQFDEGPLALYWYARSAVGMPLLQFLAFYQVIEYFYPTYSQENARRRIHSILIDPTFRNDRDADIGKLLSAVTGTRGGFGSERSQLKSTLIACLDPSDLRDFLSENQQRIDFFSKPQKGLTNYKIPLAKKDGDFREVVSDLIYDIRCKVVHTKGEGEDGEVKLLLPLSKEAQLLHHDIELMQFVARKVLISASVTLTV